MQNDADLVKELGVISEIVYKDDYFVENNPDTIINQSDHPQLQNTYTVRATRDLPSGFQAMFLENTAPHAGDPQYVFAFRGTEGDAWKSDFPEFFKDLVIADIAYMGTGTTPQQMKDAMAFVNEVMQDENLNVTLNASNTIFTGHSLGGAIAGMAGYVYGFDAYTYNGFGIQNMLWDADDTSSENHPNEMGFQDPLDPICPGSDQVNFLK